jgi:lysophospholipase L1-like esterase
MGRRDGLNGKRRRRHRRRPVWRALLALAVLALVAGAVLGGEFWYTRGRDYLDAGSAPPVRGTFGSDRSGTGRPLRLVVAGDSTGAGLGATTTATTVGGAVAAGLAERTGRQVVLGSVAVSGARAADMPGQAAGALALRPDVILMLVGGNDTTHLTRLGAVRDDLGQAVMAIRTAGVQVVVGTCPDMGARSFPQPLRALSAFRGRQVASAQREAVTAAGGVAVSLAELVGPAFRADPATSSSDLFHPSDRGYALWAGALLPAVVAAVPP